MISNGIWDAVVIVLGGGKSFVGTDTEILMECW